MEAGVEARIEDARRAETEGQWRLAIDAFTQLAHDSGDLVFLVRAALSAQRGGLAEEAESILKGVLLSDPNCAEAYARLGWILNDANRLEEARTMLVAALAIRETQPELNLLGAVEQQLGNRDAAIAVLRRSLELRPDDGEAHHMLGLSLLEEQPTEAIAHFQRAHEIDPDLPHVLREWGRALWAARRRDEAVQKLRAATSFDSEDGWAYSYLGNLLLEMGEAKDAKVVFLRAVAIEPRNGFFWGNVGKAHEELHELEQAEKCFRRGLAVEFDDPYLYRRYGLLLKRVGKPQKAKKYLRRALELNPTDDAARTALIELD